MAIRLNLAFCAILTFGVFLNISEYESLPIPREKRDTDSALNFMEKYGYNTVGTGIGQMVDPDAALTDSITIFQKVWGLPITGVLDHETLRLMTSDRCGNTDDTLVLQEKGLARKKRYVLTRPWTKTFLTWNISNFNPSKNTLPPDVIDRAFTEAFQQWQNASVLTISRDRMNPDINISFSDLVHPPCKYPFPRPGPGDELGHAFYPQTTSQGQMHFDRSENWTYKTDGGVLHFDLANVALHEIGHVLGLDHSKKQQSVMYPYYAYKANITLLSDDIEGIQALYAINKPTTTPTPLQTWCNNGTISAAASTNAGETMFFRGTEFAIIDRSGGIKSYFPAKIVDSYPALKTSLDAALTLPTLYVCSQAHVPYNKTVCLVYETYFFQGTGYITFQGTAQTDIGTIATKFPGIPNSPDSATVRGDGKIYFTKGNQIFLYSRSDGLVKGYPKKISDEIAGLPDNIDASQTMVFTSKKAKNRTRGANGTNVAVQLNFFVGTGYYQVNDNAKAVTRAVLIDDKKYKYPRLISKWWFNCKDHTSAAKLVASMSGNQTGDLSSPNTILSETNALADFSGLDLTLGAIEGHYTKNDTFVPLSLMEGQVDAAQTDNSEIVNTEDNPQLIIAALATDNLVSSGDGSSGQSSNSSQKQLTSQVHSSNTRILYDINLMVTLLVVAALQYCDKLTSHG